jgi:hypothetical protein
VRVLPAHSPAAHDGIGRPEILACDAFLTLSLEIPSRNLWFKGEIQAFGFTRRHRDFLV